MNIGKLFTVNIGHFSFTEERRPALANITTRITDKGL